MKDIFESLPNNLHLARNSNAPKSDRWRIYNTANEKYIESTGAETAEKCMEKYIIIENKVRENWLEGQ
ncbi:MAG: hypothetical protein GY804_06880 [Alphaproteobacteria bacterium]|nr:hypothetical protein [Alphaproteobacteria bacterium]